MQNQFRFSLLGCHIELRSSSDLAYMEQVFRHLEEKMVLTQEALRLNDPLKTAIITAFLLVDDLLCEREEKKALLPLAEGQNAGDLAQEMIGQLQDLLQNEK